MPNRRSRAFVCRVCACGPDGVRGRRRVGFGAGAADHDATAAGRAATGPNLPPRLADTEVRISGNTPFTVGCVTGGGVVYRNSEVEPQVAVNPRDPGNIVVTWQQDRWSTGGASGIVTAASTDGGTTWTQAAFPVSRCGGGNAGNGGNYGRATDPWVTFGPTGVVYQMALAFEGNSLQPGSRSAMLVARSTDGGRTLERRDTADHERQQFLQRQEHDHGRSDRSELRLRHLGPARARWRRPGADGAHDGRRCQLGSSPRDLRPRSAVADHRQPDRGAAQRHAGELLHADRPRARHNSGRDDPADPLDRSWRQLERTRSAWLA